MELKNDWCNMHGQIWSNLQTMLIYVCVLQIYHSVQDVLVSFGRRTLCYPLSRHFSLITRAVKDVACIFQSGEFCLFLYFPVKHFSHFQATKGSGWGSRLNVWPVPHPINPAVLPPHYQNPCCHHNLFQLQWRKVS